MRRRSYNPTTVAERPTTASLCKTPEGMEIDWDEKVPYLGWIVKDRYLIMRGREKARQTEYSHMRLRDTQTRHRTYEMGPIIRFYRLAETDDDSSRYTWRGRDVSTSGVYWLEGDVYDLDKAGAPALKQLAAQLVCHGAAAHIPFKVAHDEYRNVALGTLGSLAQGAKSATKYLAFLNPQRTSSTLAWQSPKRGPSSTAPKTDKRWSSSTVVAATVLVVLALLARARKEP